MANWVSASTTDYWQDFTGGATYLGGGSWECGAGPNSTDFYESLSSPFRPDPYYYTSTTHYGIRFTLSWNPDSSSNSNVRVSIFTNESGYSSYTQTLVFPDGQTTNNSYLIEWTPLEGERVIQIKIDAVDGDFGSFYGSTPIVSGIEVDTEGGGEPETHSHLYKHTGRKEVFETVIISAPTLPKLPNVQRSSPIAKGIYPDTAPWRRGSPPFIPSPNTPTIPGAKDNKNTATITNPDNKLVVGIIIRGKTTHYVIISGNNIVLI